MQGRVILERRITQNYTKLHLIFFSWILTSKVGQDIKKTHQAHRSIINLVGRYGREDCRWNLHLDETLPPFTLSVRSSADPRDLKPLLAFYSTGSRSLHALLVLGGSKYLTNGDHCGVGREAAVRVCFMHNIEEQI